MSRIQNFRSREPPGIRPPFILPSLTAMVDQYPEIHLHSIGILDQLKDTFKMQINVFVYCF